MLNQIVNILKDYTEVPAERINLESRLTEDLGFNSLDLINIILAFEDIFDIEIPESDVKKIHTVGDIVEYLQKM